MRQHSALAEGSDIEVDASADEFQSDEAWKRLADAADVSLLLMQCNLCFTSLNCSFPGLGDEPEVEKVI